MTPRTKEQLNQLKTEKRNLIKKVALELFANEGYHNTSMATIAQKAGISKGLTYTYFESKEALVKDIALTTLKEMLALFRFDPDTPTVRELFEVLIERNFQWIVKNSSFLRLYFSIIMQPPVFKLIENELMEMAGIYFAESAAFLEKRGIENPIAELRYFNSLLDGINMNYVLEPDTFPLEEIKARVVKQYQTQFKDI